MSRHVRTASETLGKLINISHFISKRVRGTMSWLLVTLATLLALFMTYQLISFLRLRHIPGPSWAAWTHLWMVRSQLTGQMHFILHDLTKEYGTHTVLLPQRVLV